MSEIYNLIGYELEEGLQYLKELGKTYRAVETRGPKASYPDDAPKRIIRLRPTGPGEVEVLYSVDTYQLKKESDL